MSKNYLKYALYTLATSLFSILLVTANFILPSYDRTVITGVEVKRMDKDGVITKQNPADGPVRDVYFIFTKDPKDNSLMVYRNEDTRFGFPFYFKFDSADVQAEATSYIDDHQLVDIRYYGWRIRFWDEFSNAVSIFPVEKDQGKRLPIISYFLYSIIIGFWIICIIMIRKKV